MKKALLLSVLLALPLASNANVLTFDSLPANSFTSLTTDGFTVTASSNGMDFVSSGGSSFCGPACVFNGTHHLMGWLGGSFTLSKTDGSAFSVFGFDGGETHMDRQAQWAQNILITGTKTDGSTVSQSFALDFINDGEGPLNDFQTFVASGFTGLTSLHFEGIGGDEWFTVDNVQLDGTVKVPEPSSMLLVVLGLLGLGAARKKVA